MIGSGPISAGARAFKVVGQILK